MWEATDKPKVTAGTGRRTITRDTILFSSTVPNNPEKLGFSILGQRSPKGENHAYFWPARKRDCHTFDATIVYSRHTFLESNLLKTIQNVFSTIQLEKVYSTISVSSSLLFEFCGYLGCFSFDSGKYRGCMIRTPFSRMRARHFEKSQDTR